MIVLLSDGAANTGPLYYPATSPYLVTPCHQGIVSAQAATIAGSTVYSIGYDVGHDRCQDEVTATQARYNEVPAITACRLCKESRATRRSSTTSLTRLS